MSPPVGCFFSLPSLLCFFCCLWGSSLVFRTVRRRPIFVNLLFFFFFFFFSCRRGVDPVEFFAHHRLFQKLHVNNPAVWISAWANLAAGWLTIPSSGSGAQTNIGRTEFRRRQMTWYRVQSTGAENRKKARRITSQCRFSHMARPGTGHQLASHQKHGTRFYSNAAEISSVIIR